MTFIDLQLISRRNDENTLKSPFSSLETIQAGHDASETPGDIRRTRRMRANGTTRVPPPPPPPLLRRHARARAEPMVESACPKGGGNTEESFLLFFFSFFVFFSRFRFRKPHKGEPVDKNLGAAHAQPSVYRREL